MKYLLLYLDGPLQSWGSDSRFDLRKTLTFPAKSGIYGMLLASSGDSGPQEELLARMADCPVTVVTFKSDSRILQDFHMVGSGYDDRDPWQKLLIPKTSEGKAAVGGGAKLTYREYLQNRFFAVIAGLPDDLAEKFAASLQQPVFDLYLGRKCCAPASMIFRGIFAAQSEAFDALSAYLQEHQKLVPEWIYGTAAPGSDSDAFLLNDVPVRFGQHRLYRDRWVSRKPFCQEEENG